MKPAAVITAVVLAFFTAAFASTCAVAQEGSDTGDDPLKERLGVRVGYARTQNRLSDAYGAGLNLALHFTQRIRKPFSIDVTVGAIYLGSTDKDIQFPDFDTAWFDDVSMRILMLTAAPMVEVEVSDRTSYYFSVGAGLYSATLILDQALTELDLTKNYFGINANVGATRRIFTNWFLDLNLHVHRFWTPDDPRSVDWIYLFSDGDSDPLFWTITGGVGLRLF